MESVAEWIRAPNISICLNKKLTQKNNSRPISPKVLQLIDISKIGYMRDQNRQQVLQSFCKSKIYITYVLVTNDYDSALGSKSQLESNVQSGVSISKHMFSPKPSNTFFHP